MPPQDLQLSPCTKCLTSSPGPLDHLYHPAAANQGIPKHLLNNENESPEVGNLVNDKMCPVLNKYYRPLCCACDMHQIPKAREVGGIISSSIAGFGAGAL